MIKMLQNSLIPNWLASRQMVKLATSTFPVNRTVVYKFFEMAKVEDIQQCVLV